VKFLSDPRRHVLLPKKPSHDCGCVRLDIASLAPLSQRDALQELFWDLSCPMLSHFHASSLKCNTHNAYLLSTFLSGTPKVIQYRP
jgi:hypothetical protein